MYGKCNTYYALDASKDDDIYFHFSPWSDNEPADNKEGFCGAMNSDGRLHEANCGDAPASAKFICERPLGAPPLCGDGWEHNGQSCYKV